MRFLLLLTIFINTIFAAQIDDVAKVLNYQREYKTALEMAKKANKPIMLVVVADYCPWCKKFEHKTLEDTLVQEAVSKGFIPLIVDKLIEKGSFPSQYEAKLIPTTYFINPKTGESLYEVTAYRPKGQFLKDLNEAINAYKDEK